MKAKLFVIKNLIMVVVLVAIDQITKVLAQNSLKDSKPIVLIKKVLSLQYLDGGNRGAAFGIFQNKRIFFIIITIFAVLLICKFLFNIYKLNKTSNYSLNIKYSLLQIAEVVLIAGAIGNFIDRLFFGVVCDFIQFDFIDFPLFNVADCYVTVSVAMIFIISVFCLSEKEFGTVFRIRFGDKNE